MSTLAGYKQLTPALKSDDLLLDDPTGDVYWTSEYATPAGPARFHCGFILHFASEPGAAVRVETYETAPTVWAGEHWALSAHGVGFGRYHDLRFVEPSVQDRVHLLDVIDGIARQIR